MEYGEWPADTLTAFLLQADWQTELEQYYLRLSIPHFSFVDIGSSLMSWYSTVFNMSPGMQLWQVALLKF